MGKLVIVIGDYSGGTAEEALYAKSQNEEFDLTKVRTGDSADARVLSEIIRQDPCATRVITLPVARQFSPNSAGAITKKALEWGFEVLESEGSYPGFEDINEISIVANVAPGIKGKNGHSVGQMDKDSNADREAFISGTVTKGNKTINLGTTNAFLEGEGHTLGHVTGLEKEGYKLSPFRTVINPEAEELLRENGQFRSRALLAYMNRIGTEGAKYGEENWLVLAQKIHTLLSDEHKEEDLDKAEQIFKSFQNFLPTRSGDPKKGFVTVISPAAGIDAKLQSAEVEYAGQFISGISFDGDETEKDKQIISKISEEEQKNYRLTRQAHLASNLANEFDTTLGTGQRTIIIDSEDSDLSNQKYVVKLKNGSHIITSEPRTLALTTHTIETVNGIAYEESGAFKAEAEKFREHLADKAIENDSYRNVKLALPFGIERAAVLEKLNTSEVPKEKAVALTIRAKTGDLEEEQTVYYVPNSTSGFGIWGHPKISSGSTILDNPNNTENHQAEIFSPGCPTAGYLFTVIPGVTSFSIEKADLVDMDTLAKPSTTITGRSRTLHGMSEKDQDTEWKAEEKPRIFHDLHAKFLKALEAFTALEFVSLSSTRERSKNA